MPEFQKPVANIERQQKLNEDYTNSNIISDTTLQEMYVQNTVGAQAF